MVAKKADQGNLQTTDWCLVLKKPSTWDADGFWYYSLLLIGLSNHLLGRLLLRPITIFLLALQVNQESIDSCCDTFRCCTISWHASNENIDWSGLTLFQKSARPVSYFFRFSFYCLVYNIFFNLGALSFAIRNYPLSFLDKLSKIL